MFTATQSMNPLFDQPDQDATMTSAGLIDLTGCTAFVGACLAPFATISAAARCQASQSAAAAWSARLPVVDNISMPQANFTDADKAPSIANARRLRPAPVVSAVKRLALAHGPRLTGMTGSYPWDGGLVARQLKRPPGGSTSMADGPPAASVDWLK